MPWAPKRPCRHRGCPALVNGRYCEDHQAEADERERERKARLDEQRPSAAARGYDRPWQERRKRILRRDPICRICRKKPSKHVDHIVPKAEGGTDDDWNLQGVCHGCHSRKTATEDST